MEKVLFRVAEVVKLTGLSERSIRLMLKDGRLRGVRPANVRAVFIPKSEVDRLVGTPAHQR